MEDGRKADIAYLKHFR